THQDEQRDHGEREVIDAGKGDSADLRQGCIKPDGQVHAEDAAKTKGNADMHAPDHEHEHKGESDDRSSGRIEKHRKPRVMREEGRGSGECYWVRIAKPGDVSPQI